MGERGKQQPAGFIKFGLHGPGRTLQQDHHLISCFILGKNLIRAYYTDGIYDQNR